MDDDPPSYARYLGHACPGMLIATLLWFGLGVHLGPLWSWGAALAGIGVAGLHMAVRRRYVREPGQRRPMQPALVTETWLQAGVLAWTAGLVLGLDDIEGAGLVACLGAFTMVGWTAITGDQLVPGHKERRGWIIARASLPLAGRTLYLVTGIAMLAQTWNWLW